MEYPAPKLPPLPTFKKVSTAVPSAVPIGSEPSGKNKKKVSNDKKESRVGRRVSSAKRTPATRNSSRATAAQSPDLSAQVSDLQAQIAALKALVEQPQASPVSGFQSQPSASSPTTDFPVSGIKSQVSSSIPIYELKETRPVGYQSSDLLDSSSEGSQDGFFTGLLDRARMQWLMEDWEGLAKIDLEQIEHHPDRAKIALFASDGLVQVGEYIKAQQFIRKAKDWGVSKKLACKILAAGMHKILGQAAVSSGNKNRGLKHFKLALIIGDYGFEKKLLTQARISEQYKRVAGTGSHPHLNETLEAQLSHGTNISDVASFQEKLKNAREARAGKDYGEAEVLLQEVLRDDPKNVEVLLELGRVKSAQNNWKEAIDVYNRLLKTQTITLEAILARARMRLNTGDIKGSIAELEQAKALGFESTSLTHQLAVAYRDDRQWEAAEQQIDEVMQTDARYAYKKISFATFAADVLRKRDRVKKAQTLLQGAVNAANAQGVTIPLNTSAILQELNRASELSHTSREVSKYFYDSIYEQSEKYQVDPEDSVYLPVWETVCDALKARGALRVLDIGCGPGQFAQYVLKQIPKLEYIGVDYSETAIREARRKCLTANFLERDLMQKDSMSDLHADAYIVLEVLEHLEKDCELLSRISPGQWVVISVPNFDSFGHVRFFENEDEVMARYAAIFEDFHSETIELGGRSKIFLVSGIRNRFVTI